MLGEAQPTLIITGSSGFIGKNFLKAYGADFDVLPIIHRRPLNGPSTYREALQFEELTPQIVRSLGRPGVLHLCGASREEQPGSLWASIVGTTERLIELARTAPLDRVVYLSGYGVCASSSVAYFRAKAEAERLLLSETSFFSFVLRPSYILGSGDEITPHLAEQARKGLVEIPGSGRYRLQPLLIDDVVTILNRTLRCRMQKSRVIDLLGEEVDFASLVERLLHAWKSDAKIANVDLEVLIRRAIFSRRPDFSLSELAVLLADKVGSPSREVLGVRLQGVDEIVASLSV